MTGREKHKTRNRGDKQKTNNVVDLNPTKSIITGLYEM